MKTLSLLFLSGLVVFAVGVFAHKHCPFVQQAVGPVSVKAQGECCSPCPCCPCSPCGCGAGRITRPHVNPSVCP